MTARLYTYISVNIVGVASPSLELRYQSASSKHRMPDKATPNKFPVSRPELMQNSMRAGGPFPLFHYFLNGSEISKSLGFIIILAIC